MARTLTKKRWLAISGALLAVCSVAMAEALPDPTRPPASIESPAAQEGDAAAQAQSGLQAIIRRAGTRPAAIIDGRHVELGGAAREGKLIHIGEDSVTLQGAGGKETLKLTPNAGKTMAKAVDSVSRRKKVEAHK